MAYDKEKIYKQAEEAIIENDLYFIEDVVAFIPCSKQTFYDFFPLQSYEMDTLKSLLEANKINTKVELRKQFKDGTNSVEKLALYKLIGTDEERKKLSQTYQDITTKGESIRDDRLTAEDFL